MNIRKDALVFKGPPTEVIGRKTMIPIKETGAFDRASNLARNPGFETALRPYSQPETA